MPQTTLLFFRDASGIAPVVEWLRELRQRDAKGYAKCVAAIRRLADVGHELRRPVTDYLRDGIYELRVKRGHVNYRILYFFHGQQVAVLAGALAKEDVVPPIEIHRTIAHKKLFATDPERYTFDEASEANDPAH